MLEEESIILPSVTRGKCTVSATLLAPPDNHDSGYSSGSWGGSSSSVSSVSISCRSFSYSRDFTLNLPESAHSVAALEFIGFTTQTATWIFNNWISRPDPERCPDDLIDYVLAHPSMLLSAQFQHLSLNQGMAQLGLTEDFQDAITDPCFSRILWTERPIYWIKDTLRINYLTLIQLQNRLSNHAKRSLAKKAKQGSLEAVFQPAQPAQPTAPTPPFQTTTLTMTSEDYNLPRNYVTVQSASPVLPDHYVLYKSRAASDMEGWIQEDETLNMTSISSYGGCDFNYGSVACYWTPELETAEIYRAWIQRRYPYSDTWMIRIQVPKTFIDSLRTQNLWYSHDWKEYVWHCKKRMIPPEKFDSYWRAEGAHLVKGHIYAGFRSPIASINKEELQTKISEDNVLTISTVKATQWVIMRHDVIDSLGKEMLEKIHIDITAASISSDPALEPRKNEEWIAEGGMNEPSPPAK